MTNFVLPRAMMTTSERMRRIIYHQIILMMMIVLGLWVTIHCLPLHLQSKLW
jgi:hypothetical protein